MLPPQLVILPLQVGPSDLACAEMLANLWLVLPRGYVVEYIVMVWDYCQAGSIPIARLYQSWARMVGLASTSTHHSPSASGQIRFSLVLCWNGSHLCLVLPRCDSMECIVMVQEHCQIVPIPIASRYKPWVRIVCIASISTHHSPSASGPLRFGLCWNVGQFVICSTIQ